MSNTKYFADLIKVCSVLPVFAVMPAMAEQVHIGTGVSQMLTGKHLDAVDSDGALYFLKSADSQNLATLVVDGATLSNVTSLYKSGHGVGVITGYENSKIVVKNSEFSDNKADYYAAIFAVAPEGDIKGGDLTITDSKFLRNEALDGAAIGAMHTTRMTNVLFEENKATSGASSSDGGGALFLGAVSQTILTDVTFKNNSSAAMGGALSMRSAEEGDNKNAKLDIFDSDFTGNTAGTNGGAIYSTFYDSETVKDSVYINGTDFTLNSANSGGAIYTEGLADLGGGKASMKIVDADFEHNTATESGGAIYNGSNMTLVDVDFYRNVSKDYGGAIANKGMLTVGAESEFIGNTAANNGGAIYNMLNASIGVLKADFVANNVNGESSEPTSGGALYNGGKIGSVVGVFNENIVTASGESLTAKGGAIYSWADLSAHATIDSIVADFNGNLVVSVGYAIGGAIVNDGKIGTLYQSSQGFVNNVADGQNYSLGGAFHNSEYATIDELVADFVGNSATASVMANGGALMNKGHIELLTGRFENNSVTNAQYAQGGAIYNATNTYDEHAQTAELTIVDSIFENNFIDSVDADWAEGGAIYNELDSFVTFKGTNTFSGNTVNGVANDIYNDGALTIASGMTSIDGGINGTGALDIKSGATLNMNYASIEQGTINIDGTLMASLRDANDTVDIAGTLSGDGKVLLSAGAIGTYDISAFKDFATEENIDFGKTYDIKFGKDMLTATLSSRDAQSIAADTGASVAAAGAVSGLANVTDAKLQQVSLMMQEALNNGDIETVEQEVAKVNPNKKPVGQSVSSSVQNQVLTVAAGRMSTVGGSTGRAGGDVTGAGVWAQGMFNKTKMGSAFEGNSRGFAMGGDTLINNVFTLGGGYAYSDTDVLGGGRDIDVESNSIFVYGQYKPAAWYVNSTLTYTESEYSDAANMAAGFALGSDYDIKAYGAQVMTGYDFASGVTPEVGLRYLHTNQGEHENAFGATVREMDMDFLSGVAGLKYAFAIESDTAVKFSPEMRAAMTYDFISDDATATVVFPGAAAYYVDVDRLSRLGGEFGIGLTAEYRGLELSLNYELDLHKDYTSQTGLFKFRYNF